MMLTKLLRDPLLHFTLIGAALFGVYDLLGGSEERRNEEVIVIDHNALLTFIQYRSKAFQKEQAKQQLADMSTDELQQLIAEYVREEALYREAQALGMIENDYIIRRRSVQKLEFIAQGIAEQAITVDADAVEAYFDQRRQDYYEAPSFTFTHVFVKGEEGAAEHTQRQANTLLQQLNIDQIDFSSAIRFGDRFLYHRNYVERTPDFIASHFGEAFKDRLAQLSASNNSWQGPIASDHGYHLVMLTEQRPGRVPALTEISDRVEADFRHWQQQQKQELAIQQIVEQYDVEYRL